MFAVVVFVQHWETRFMGVIYYYFYYYTGQLWTLSEVAGRKYGG